MRAFLIRNLLFSLLLASLAHAQSAAPLDQFAPVDALLQNAIRNGQIPGAVALVWHDGRVVYRKALGDRALEPQREPMTVDTVFDLASLTKVIATTPAIMQLEERGQIRLNDAVAKYLPEFAQNGKQDITVRMLLTHFSGLPPDLDRTHPWEGRETAYRMAMEVAPDHPPGARFVYSDINFIVLGELVERVSGMALEDYCRTNIFDPLGMSRTRYLPPADWISDIAPTEYDEHGKMLRGVVHDPTARRMGGVAGDAGVFGTADDLARFATAVLEGSSVLSPLAVEKMTTPQQPPTAEELRGLGWDIDSPFSSNRGDLLPVGSYGHTGFTGTSLWIDPTTRTFIILLTNSVHPRGGSNVIDLRAKFATAVTAALSLTVSEQEAMKWVSITGYNETQTAARRVAARNGMVRTGIDVLAASQFAALRGKGAAKRIGLLTNQTGVDAQGRRTIDVLASAPGISLQAIFSPEHGVTGTLDTTAIGNSKDGATGVSVYSVYGGTDAARRPSLDVLKKLDAVVIDIQDAGTRFYTYETTLGYFLEAAAEAGIEVVVLDRPNPINGSFVQGPISDSARSSFTNYWSVPVRHGMTLGELAKMFNAEKKITAKLTVIPMEGWLRGDWYDSTGLMWVNPSPNLRSVTEAALYPGVALIEGTNVSVGRGTGTPFELVGAPWIKAAELAQYLNAREISGVRFVPISFTPDSNVYANQLCYGVNILLTARNSLDAPELGIELAAALRKLYPQQFQVEKMLDLVANQSAYDALVQGQDPRRIAQDWQDALNSFQLIRQKYLIYR